MLRKNYRTQWQFWLNADRDESQLKRLACKVANSFMDRYFQDGTYCTEYIDLLCEMATSHDDPALNQPASSALFGIIVEQLCDDFEDEQQDVYNRVMAQVINYCRTLPGGTELDEHLRQFKLSNWQDIYNRANTVQARNSQWKGKPPKRIFILSRITIGADVAITSVLLQRLHTIFPDSEIVLIGSGKLDQLFGSNPYVTIRTIDYRQRGGILERLRSWYDVLDILYEKDDDGFLVIDPDSRISQLGVLPLTHMDNYLFFNTRQNFFSSEQISMVKMTNDWVNKTFGQTDFCYSGVWQSQQTKEAAETLTGQIRQGGQKRITTVNLGVGGNVRKRLGIEFEKKLLLALLEDPDATIILDKGFGPIEQSNCRELLAAAQAQGHTASEATFGQLDNLNPKARVLAVESSIGEIASLINQSDDFIGYDSACQHIAVALEVPTVTIFAGTNNRRFIRRWAAFGKKPSTIVHVNTLYDPDSRDNDEVVERALYAHKQVTTDSAR